MINWDEFNFQASTHKAVPVLGEEFVDILQQELSNIEEKMIPLSEDTKGKNQLSLLLVMLATCQKFAKDVGEQGAELRDRMFQHVLRDIPYDIIELSAKKYISTKSDYPAPVDLLELCQEEWYKRRMIVKKLTILLHKALNPSLADTVKLANQKQVKIAEDMGIHLGRHFKSNAKTPIYC